MMNALNNLKTKAKLLLSSGMICLALLIVGGVSVAGLMQLSECIETIFRINVLPLKQLGELQGQSQRMNSLVAGHILTRDGATMRKNIMNPQPSSMSLSADQFFRATICAATIMPGKTKPIGPLTRVAHATAPYIKK